MSDYGSIQGDMRPTTLSPSQFHHVTICFIHRQTTSDISLLLPNSNTTIQSSTGLSILARNDPVSSRPDTKTTLDSLPDLDRAYVDDDATECDAPLPGDGTMLEHLFIDDREVDNGEDDKQSGDDREEEEAVAPDGSEDGQTGWGRGRSVGVHVEK